MQDEFSVDVLQEDIDNGVQCHSNKCALAIAIKRTFGFYTKVLISSGWLASVNGCIYIHSGSQFIEDFDNDIELCKPCTITFTKIK